MDKILEILDQNLQINNLSKFATFDPIVQLPHLGKMVVITSMIVRFIIRPSFFWWSMDSLSLGLVRLEITGFQFY